METGPRPTILVSSTVYGIEELLDRIYMVLTTFGYEVWMSHKGTLPVRSWHRLASSPARSSWRRTQARVRRCAS